MQRRASPFFHGDVGVVGRRPHELRFAAVHCYGGWPCDGFGHPTTPSRLEGAHDVRFGFRRRRRRKEKRILELDPGERHGTINSHTASELLCRARRRLTARPITTSSWCRLPCSTWWSSSSIASRTRWSRGR